MCRVTANRRISKHQVLNGWGIVGSGESRAWQTRAWRTGSGIVDDRVFDRLARSVSQGSRRTLMLSALAGALGLGVIDADETRAVSINTCVSKPTPKTRKECCNRLSGAKQRRCLKKIKKTPPPPQCVTDGDCTGGQVCSGGQCETCPGGTTGCEGECLDLSVCPADQQHTQCNNSPGCICTRLADNNNSRFCAVSTTCDVHCGPNNSCPNGQSCVMTCCDGPGNAGLRCLPSCG